MNECVKRVQASNYGPEIEALKKGRGIHKSSSLQKLTPFLDEEQLLRVGGRLERFEELPRDARHSIILPAKHPLSNLVIQDAHEKNFHSQTLRTHYDVRSRF
jgi:hypothetical protein